MKKPATTPKVQTAEKTPLTTAPSVEANLEADPPVLVLSKREQDCIQYLLKNKTNAEIGKALGLSTRTIEFYINNLKIKLFCYSKKSLVRKLQQLDCSKMTGAA